MAYVGPTIEAHVQDGLLTDVLEPSYNLCARATGGRTVPAMQPYAYAAPGESRHRKWALVGLCISALTVAGLALVGEFHVAVLACVPAVVILPLLVLLDRVEPESPTARWFAFAWGFGISAIVAGILNSFVAEMAGSVVGLDSNAAFAVAAVCCAPVVEELLKAVPLRRAIGSGLVSSPVDAVIMAGWSAVGFTVIENIQYLSTANTNNELWSVFLLRCAATPFAHTLYASCTAIGASAYARHGIKSRAHLGLIAAIALHALWNGSAVLSISLESYTPIVAMYLAQGTLLVCITIWLVRNRNHERDTVARLAATFPPDGAAVHARRGYDPRRSLLFATVLSSELAHRKPTEYHIARANHLYRDFTFTSLPAYLLPPPTVRLSPLTTAPVMLPPPQAPPLNPSTPPPTTTWDRPRTDPQGARFDIPPPAPFANQPDSSAPVPPSPW